MTAARTRRTNEPGAPAGSINAAAKDAAADAQPEHPRASSKQLRQMHALLAGHGVNGDATRHDYLTTWAERTIEHASDLTTVEAARLIAELDSEDAPEVTTLSRTALRKIREPFAEQEVGKLPRSLCRNCSSKQGEHPGGPGTCPEHRHKAKCQVCGNYHNTQATMHIDFVGHADVTARLLDVDPAWTWRPFTPEEMNGVPPAMRDGLWIMLTVCGVTRPGFGEGASGQQVGGDQVKVAIGDALRNAGMRFGIALDLWAKGDREWANTEKYGAEGMHPDEPAPREQTPPPPYDGPTVEDSIGALIGLADQQSTDLATITRRFREEHGNLTVDQLATDVPAHALDVFVGQCRDYLAQQAGPAGAQA